MFLFQVVWKELFDGARPIYEALKKVDFSQETYNELLGLYSEKLDRYISNTLSDEVQNQILQDVACEWLNKADEYYGRTRKNYERWTLDSDSRFSTLQLAR